jgi:stress response protein YsnF
VPINRIVTEALPVRYEGDTTIISLLEEVLVVEKRLMLREEVHIKRVHKEVHKPQEVLLREERVEVVRKPTSGQGIRQEMPQELPKQ